MISILRPKLFNLLNVKPDLKREIALWGDNVNRIHCWLFVGMRNDGGTCRPVLVADNLTWDERFAVVGGHDGYLQFSPGIRYPNYGWRGRNARAEYRRKSFSTDASVCVRPRWTCGLLDEQRWVSRAPAQIWLTSSYILADLHERKVEKKGSPWGEKRG